MDVTDELYPGGFYKILRDHERARRPFDRFEGFLPPVDTDLAALKAGIVAPPAGPPEGDAQRQVEAKYTELQTEFAGGSQLLLWHAVLIAVLRRDDPPDEAVTLFLRFWTEEGAFLADRLSTRWKISAATTFADHGRTGDQRAVGMGLSVLFDMVKLHDSERRRSGRPGRQPFSRTAGRIYPLAFDMVPVHTGRVDADRNMLARLWRTAERDPVIFPLARSMLQTTISDPRSIFGRLQVLRRQWKAKQG